MPWMPLKSYSDVYDWPSVATLRWLTWRIEKESGTTAPYIQRWGKRVLIDPDKFQLWISTKEAQELRKSWIEKDREEKKRKQSKQAVPIIN